MPSSAPIGFRLIAYQVGFGDCFLLTYRYARGERHVLVDFGTMELPAGAPRDQLRRVALDIEARCHRDPASGEADPLAVVATHRHRDHVSGFSTEGGSKRSRSSGGETRATGEIIRDLRPRVVVQPWTEDPALPRTATGPRGPPAFSSRAFAQLLGEMSTISALAAKEGERIQAATRSTAYRERIGRELGFVGENNLSNLSAVKNLIAMGEEGRAVYARYRSESGLESLLPGVKVHVLGPPTVEQSAAVRRQRSEDRDEFWHLRAQLHAYWGGQARILEAADVAGTVRKARAGRSAGRGPFARAEVFDPRALPPALRLFKRRALDARGEQLLEIVRVLDDVLNNTSLVLLFQVGNLALLFPGDAQIENWSHALAGPHARRNRELLAAVDLYKVGHHGSLNATPRSLWALFEKKGPARALRTVVSTLEGVHGHEDRRTEVPRRTLVAALKAESTYFTTQRVAQGLGRFIEVDPREQKPAWSAWEELAAPDVRDRQ
jgi:hypothetical protein